MQREPYPIESVEDSLESHLCRHSGRGQAIYLAIVALLLGAIATLPFVRVGVSVQSRGIIRPVIGKHEVRAQAAGFAEELRVAENQRVGRGDVLLTMRAARLRERMALLEARIEEARRSIHDLELLSRGATPPAARLDGFRSPTLRQEYARYRNAVEEAEAGVEKAGRELERVQALARGGLAARAEVEEREFQLSRARAERDLRVLRYRSEWQSALAAARIELRSHLSGRAEAEEERALYTVVAPVAGTIQELAAISPGSFVQAGEEVAVISPLSELVAEVYVSPRDIGLLRAGDPVRLLIDAYDHNEWGVVAGHVSEISGDFIIVADQPVFRVGVTLDRTELRLKNGFTGRLMKGMTLEARFMLAERTLLQLLRDDVDDWLDPTRAGSAGAR